MAIEVAAFIDLEQRAQGILQREMAEEVRPLAKDIQEAARREDLRRISRLSEQLNFAPVKERVRGRMELVALSTVVFGAAVWDVGQDATDTVFFRRREIPSEIAMAVDATLQFIDGGASENVRRAVQEIAWRAEHQGLPVVKAPNLRARGQLATALNKAVKSGTKVQASIAANAQTARLAALGALSEGLRRGRETYQWNAILDARVCPICRGLHGRTFQLRPSLDRLLAVIRSQDPEVARALTPWPRSTLENLANMAGQTNEQLQQRGIGVPPAHARCRCVVSRVGTVDLSQVTSFAAARAAVAALREGSDVG